MPPPASLTQPARTPAASHPAKSQPALSPASTPPPRQPALHPAKSQAASVTPASHPAKSQPANKEARVVLNPFRPLARIPSIITLALVVGLALSLSGCGGGGSGSAGGGIGISNGGGGGNGGGAASGRGGVDASLPPALLMSASGGDVPCYNNSTQPVRGLDEGLLFSDSDPPDPSGDSHLANHLRHLANCLGNKSIGTNSNPEFYTDDTDAEFNSQYGFSFGPSSGPILTYDSPDDNAVYLHGFHHAYARGYTGNGSVIAVADSGVWLDHPDLQGKVIAWKNFHSPAAQTPARMARNSYHGTFISGIIAGNRDDGKNDETITLPGGIKTFNIHGVAFDAKLAVLKIGEGRDVLPARLNGADGGYAWARQQNATAITHSFGPELTEEYHSTIRPTSKRGEWYSDHGTYGNVGFTNIVRDAYNARNYAGDEMIIVIAAGNNRTLPYALGNSQMAIATDPSSGDLILGGRAIVVGWWDTNTSSIFGNQAGSVCVNYENDTCLDAAVMQDYYILADGLHTSTWNRGDENIDQNYEIRSGSSYAVPVVAGATAIIRQMWPYMRGKDIVQLLLQTGNKSYTGYDKASHGQGLLDMDAATRPFGSIGIPVTGRLPPTTRLLDAGGEAGAGDAGWDAGGGDGGGAGGGDAGWDGDTGSRVALRGGVRLTSPPADKALADGLAGVMVLDAFDRDFYYDLSGVVSYNSLGAGGGGVWAGGAGDVGSASAWASAWADGGGYGVAGYAGAGGGGYSGYGGGRYGGRGLPSPYAGYFASGQHVLVPLGEAGRFQLGAGTSYDHVLGNRFSGILGTSRHSHTLYGLYNYNSGGGRAGAAGWADAGDATDAGWADAGGGGDAGTGAYAQLGLGVSYTEFDRAGSLLEEAELMVSSAAALGYGVRLGEAGWLAVGVRQPIVLERARVRYDVPVGRTAGGAVVREGRVVDFAVADEGRPLDVGVAAGLPLAGGRLAGFVEGRTRGLDFGGAEAEGRVGVRFGRRF